MVKSCNEWGKLRKVIVGTPRLARVTDDYSLSSIFYANSDKPPEGFYPEQVVEETLEDVAVFKDTLKKLDVEVFDAEPLDIKFSNGFWEAESFYSYCPRDHTTVIGTKVIESPQPIRSRYFETFSIRDILMREFKKQPFEWITAPKPMLLDDAYNTNITKDTLALNEVEPCFDAANILRCGYDILYLVSNTGNKLGADWLEAILGPKFTVHRLEGIYSYAHLDSTISLLNENTVLLNGSRINEDNCPAMFKNWDKIYFHDAVDIGHYPGYNNSSVWVGMNLISIDESTVIVEKNQTTLIKQLEAKKFNVIPLDIRHSRTLGGSFHCITLDIERDGELEKYS